MGKKEKGKKKGKMKMSIWKINNLMLNNLIFFLLFFLIHFVFQNPSIGIYMNMRCYTYIFDLLSSRASNQDKMLRYNHSIKFSYVWWEEKLTSDFINRNTDIYVMKEGNFNL